jgi:hypothetical protein
MSLYTHLARFLAPKANFFFFLPLLLWRGIITAYSTFTTKPKSDFIQKLLPEPSCLRSKRFSTKKKRQSRLCLLLRFFLNLWHVSCFFIFCSVVDRIKTFNAYCLKPGEGSLCRKKN